MRRLFLTFVLCAAAAATTACSSGVSSTQLAQVGNGMKVAQVEALLGLPTRIEESEITDMSGIISGKVYYYSSERGDAQVVLVNDRVFSTAFVAGGKKT